MWGNWGVIASCKNDNYKFQTDKIIRLAYYIRNKVLTLSLKDPEVPTHYSGMMLASRPWCIRITQWDKLKTLFV